MKTYGRGMFQAMILHFNIFVKSCWKNFIYNINVLCDKLQDFFHILDVPLKVYKSFIVIQTDFYRDTVFEFVTLCDKIESFGEHCVVAHGLVKSWRLSDAQVFIWWSEVMKTDGGQIVWSVSCKNEICISFLL